MNQELNFQSPDNNLVIKGGCDLFTTKPIGSDRKLFKTIDRHLDQILEDNQFSQLLDRKQLVLSVGSASPVQAPFLHRGSFRERSASSLLGRQLVGLLGLEMLLENEEAIDESPFGSLKEQSTRKTFAYLIAILNTTYPDHDFTGLQPLTDNFHRLELEELMRKFNNIMVSLGKKEELLGWIWDTVNVYMDLVRGSRKNEAHDGCKVYEFQPLDLLILEDLNYPYQTMWSNYWFIYSKRKKRVCFLYLTAINQVNFRSKSPAPPKDLTPEVLGDIEM